MVETEREKEDITRAGFKEIEYGDWFCIQILKVKPWQENKKSVCTAFPNLVLNFWDV